MSPTKAKKVEPEVEVVAVDETAPEVVVPDDEVVQMWNPTTPGSELANVTRGAYRETWAAKGWRIVASSQRDAEGALSYTLEPKIEVPEEADAQGSTTSTEDASSSAGSDAGSSA